MQSIPTSQRFMIRFPAEAEAGAAGAGEAAEAGAAEEAAAEAADTAFRRKNEKGLMKIPNIMA